MTNLQVAQPVFTLVLDLVVRFTAVTLAAIVGGSWDIHARRATLL